MQITMVVNLEAPLFVDDDAVREPLPEPLRSELRGQPYLGGRLEIVDAGQPDLVIHDDLEQLVPRLCVASLTPLHAGQPVTVPLFTDGGQVALRPQGDRLEIERPDGRKGHYPLAAALDALESCGNRYRLLIEHNFAGDVSRRMKLAPVRVELLRRQDEREAAMPPEPPPRPWEDEAS